MSVAGGATVARALRRPAAPYVLLAVLVLVSVGVRCFRLEQPCEHSCRDRAAASLIFDEAYYVNAARRIAGVEGAADQPTYARAPSGTDPNAEHPQLAKVVMAAGIELFGNRPLGYRVGSVIAGTAVLVLMFLLVRAAGGGAWLALGATAVLAADNLFTVHGRIATLDIYYLAFMLGGVALYLRRRPVLAGIVLGIGATTKLVGIYALFILGLLELGRWATRRCGALEPLAMCIVATGISYAVALQGLDMAFPAFDPGTGEQFHNALAHTRHMLDYAVSLTSPDGPEGIASYPWSWLAGQGTIPYLTLNSTTSAGGQVVSTTVLVEFKGAVNPFLLYLAIPALFAATARAWRKGDDLDILALAWFGGMMVPFCLQAIFQDRTTYLYYLVATLPAICLACARLFSMRGVPRAAALGWGVALAVGFVNLYPFRTIF